MSKGSKRRSDSSAFVWMSYSDLMAGLFLSFMLIFLVVNRDNKLKAAQNEEYKEQIESRRDLTANIEEQLKSVLVLIQQHKACDGVNWELDGLTLRATQKNYSRDFWFSSGKADLLPLGKECLTKFSQTWIKTIFNKAEAKASVHQLQVEGYTNTEAISNKKSEYYNKDPFIANLDLSQARAFAASSYMLEHSSFSEDEMSWARNKIAANGRSFNNLIYLDEVIKKEDKLRSIRVEFTILLKQIGDSKEEKDAS